MSQDTLTKNIFEKIYPDISYDASMFLTQARRVKTFSAEDLEYIGEYFEKGNGISSIILELQLQKYLQYSESTDTYWVTKKAYI